MIIRVAFGILLVIMLIPHEPDLGLSRQPTSAVERIFHDVRATLTTGVAHAAADLRASRSGQSVVIGKLDFSGELPDLTIRHREVPSKIAGMAE